MEQISKKNETKVTFTFVLPPSVIPKPQGLDINLPFDEWIAANKGVLPFWSPPPKEELFVPIAPGGTAELVFAQKKLYNRIKTLATQVDE